jgi:hypothetical protein
MGRRVQIVSVKQRQIDEDKLALAFLLLAKHLREQGDDAQPRHDEASETEAA